MRIKNLMIVLIICLSIVSCQKDSVDSVQNDQIVGDGELSEEFAPPPVQATLEALLASVNAGLENAGMNYRAAMVEALGKDEVGNTVIAKDVGNKQLDFDFVPNDPRRADWSGDPSGSDDNITYAIDQVDGTPIMGAVSATDATDAIERSMDTWDDANCSDLPIDRVSDFGLDLGLIADIFGLGGGPFVVADLMHCGWGDIDFSGNVIGATFTFGFTNGGVFTDVDNNGKLDAAFREIYYDPSFTWGIDSNIDIETVSLHEAEHGLSQGHFGTVAIKKDGSLKLSPKAVMNAIYSGVQQSLAGTDHAGHCSIWGSWPQN